HIYLHANTLPHRLQLLRVRQQRRLIHHQLSLRHITSPRPSLEMLPEPRPRSCPDTFAAPQTPSDPNCSTAASLLPHRAPASPPSESADAARPPACSP